MMIHHLQASIFILVSLVIHGVAGQECLPCSEGEEPLDVGNPRDKQGIQCDDVVTLAATLTAGSDECLSNQLTAYQGGCCDFPPSDYCTLCPDGSTNFNAEKTIPRESGTSTELTCQQLSSKDSYLLKGDPPGVCSATERGRASTWCECGGVFEPKCTLTCPDGNPPPDLTLYEPIFKKSCRQFMYLFTTLSADECPNAASILKFDAEAFCCLTVPSPENCSICNDGQTPSDPDKEVTIEFEGTATCEDVTSYATFLPPTEFACQDFLKDIGLYLEDEKGCCETKEGASIPNPPTVPPHFFDVGTSPEQESTEPNDESASPRSSICAFIIPMTFLIMRLSCDW